MIYPSLFFSIKNRHGLIIGVTYLKRDSLRLKRSLSGVEASFPLRLRSANGLFLCFIIKLTVLTVKPFCLSRLKWVAIMGCAIILTCLTGCGNDDLADLKQYISTVKSAPKGTIPPLPEIKVVETFIFNPTGLRDPFKPLAQPEQPDVTPEPVTGNGIKPDFTRRKEELELLPLEDLKMVGTIKMNSILWGLVKAGDGSIHRVQTGNYMGKNYGKIIRISVDKIELMEIVTEKPGVWREQQTALALTE